MRTCRKTAFCPGRSTDRRSGPDTEKQQKHDDKETKRQRESERQRNQAEERTTASCPHTCKILKHFPSPSPCRSALRDAAGSLDEGGLPLRNVLVKLSWRVKVREQPGLLGAEGCWGGLGSSVQDVGRFGLGARGLGFKTHRASRCQMSQSRIRISPRCKGRL